MPPPGGVSCSSHFLNPPWGVAAEQQSSEDARAHTRDASGGDAGVTQLARTHVDAHVRTVHTFDFRACALRTHAHTHTTLLAYANTKPTHAVADGFRHGTGAERRAYG